MMYVVVFIIGVGIGMLINEIGQTRKDLW